jgi:hypothetical protein
VLLSNSLLKIRNVQLDLPLSHRYSEPYAHIRLYRPSDPETARFLKRHPTWVYGVWAGTFSDLWDEAHFRAVAATYGLTVWRAPFGGYQEHETRDPLPAAEPNVRIGHRRVVPYVSWERFWADRDVLRDGNGTDAGLEAFVPAVPVPDSGVDVALQRENFTLVKTSSRTALMLNLGLCFPSPLCMALASAFRPNPLIVAEFVEPLMRLLPPDYVAVHYREFMCDKTWRGVAQLLPHLERLIRAGRLPGIDAVPTPRGNASDDVGGVTLYLSTAVAATELWPLREAGYRVVSKETLLRMTVLRYPFEVMALVDQEVSIRAPHFVTLTVAKGAAGSFSTFSYFVDIYRTLAQRRETQYLGDCYSISAKKKKK